MFLDQYHWELFPHNSFVRNILNYLWQARRKTTVSKIFRFKTDYFTVQVVGASVECGRAYTRNKRLNEEKPNGHEREKGTLIIKIYMYIMLWHVSLIFCPLLSPYRVLWSLLDFRKQRKHFLILLVFCQQFIYVYNDDDVHLKSHSGKRVIWLLFFFPQFTITQIICFILAIVGTAILLEHSTYESRIQPMIRHSMNRLIMYSEYEPSTTMLRLIQESVSIVFNCLIKFLNI